MRRAWEKVFGVAKLVTRTGFLEVKLEPLYELENDAVPTFTPRAIRILAVVAAAVNIGFVVAIFVHR